MELIIVLSFIVLLTLTLMIHLFIKNKKMKNDILSYLKEETYRKGYIEKNLKVTHSNGDDDISFTSIVYIKEIDRYTNGKSKIEIDKIDSGISEDKMLPGRVYEYIRSEFKHIVDTKSITWLESENEIKLVRKSKLDKIKRHLKK